MKEFGMATKGSLIFIWTKQNQRSNMRLVEGEKLHPLMFWQTICSCLEVLPQLQDSNSDIMALKVALSTIKP